MLSFSRFLVLALALVACAHASVVDMSDSFETELASSGKNLFVKFFAPWCGHCKRLKPDWDKLGDEFGDSSSVLIGDVDCTSDGGKEVCNKMGVRGYPTLKYFTSESPEDGDSYSGARSLDALSSFVKETLEARCDVNEPSSCDEKEVTYIEKMKAKDKEAVEKEITRLTDLSTGAKMSADKKQWMKKRLAILKQL